jgi:hypothetical protein
MQRTASSVLHVPTENDKGANSDLSSLLRAIPGSLSISFPQEREGRHQDRNFYLSRPTKLLTY